MLNFQNYDNWLLDLIKLLTNKRQPEIRLRSQRNLPEVKLLVNRSEQVRAGEREFQTNMAQKARGVNLQTRKFSAVAVNL